MGYFGKQCDVILSGFFPLIISEMSDGNVIWNVLESGRTVESHEMAANHTLQHPAEMSSAFQLSIKGPSSNQLAKLGQTRPETKVSKRLVW